MKGRTVSAVALAAVLGAVSPVGAQTVDYSSLEQLFGEPVTASATGKPQRASDAPVEMQIITADEIRRSAATDIPGVLADLADVEVARPTLGQADISIHGYNQPYSPRMLVLVDGRQVYLDHFGMTQWNALPVQLDEIKQIEVVKGPNAALFGFNAVSGVINIVTFNPLYDDVNRAALTVGTQNWRQGSAVGTVRMGATGIRLSAGATAAHEFSRGASALDAAYRDQSLTNRSVSADTVTQLTPFSQLRVSGSYSGANETDFLPFPSLATVDTKTYSGGIGYLADTRIGSIEATVYHNGMEARLYSAVTPFVPLDNQVTVAKLDDLFKLDPFNTVRLGIEYRNNTLKVTPSGDGGNVGYDVYSADAMWDWAINGKLSWTNAVRLDELVLNRDGGTPTGSPFGNADYDRTITGVSYNSGLIYKATGEDTFRLSTGRGLQVPSLIDLGFVQSGNNQVLTGNPNLRPTVVTNYAAGYTRDLPRLGSMASVSPFYQNNRDLLAIAGGAPNVSGPANVFFNDNIGDSDAWGVDLGLKGGRGRWRWDVNYTAQRVRDHFSSVVATYRVPVDFSDSAPAQLGNAHLGYTVGRWQLDGYAQIKSDYHMLLLTQTVPTPAWMNVNIPAHADFSARVGYDIADGLNAAVLASSVTTARYADTSGLEVERRVLLRLTAAY